MNEGTGARKHEATFESLLTHRAPHPGFPRLMQFEEASDSAILEEQAYAERIRGKEKMRMAITICVFFIMALHLKTRVASQWTYQVRLGRAD